MTTTDKNAEIARWMGAEQYTSYYKFGAKTHPEIFDFGNGKTFKQRQLKYHSDWNWIMGCISKIEKEACWVTIRGCMVEMSDAISISKPTKIEAVHEAVYQFVVWHNQQQKL